MYTITITTYRPNGSIVRTEDYHVQAGSKKEAVRIAQDYVYNPYPHVCQRCTECKKES